MYYTTRTYAIGTATIPREPVRLEQLYTTKTSVSGRSDLRKLVEFLDLERCTLLLYLACVISNDGINSFSIILL